MKFNIGDVVIGEFPFTDKEQSKVRAFLIIAIAKPYYWCLMMTKVDSLQHDDGFAYQISHSEINFTLREKTAVRMNIIQTIDPKVCTRKLGSIVDLECLERILDSIKNVLDV